MKTLLPLSLQKMLNQLTEEQLRNLNRVVIEKLKLFNKAHHLKSMAKFNVMDKVFFHHNDRKIVGTITRLNQKTATVITDDGGHWNVAPCFLKKIIEEDNNSNDNHNEYYNDDNGYIQETSHDLTYGNCYRVKQADYVKDIHGWIDEIRLSTIVRSDDWILTTANSIINATDGGFFTLGGVQGGSGLVTHIELLNLTSNWTP